MKKIKSLIFLLLFSAGFMTVSAENNVSFYVEPQTGFVSGKVGEYLYSSSGERVLSYLDFQENFVPFISLKTGFTTNNSSLNAKINYKLPLKCGKMTDSDWKLVGIKTNYGIFNNYTDWKNFDFNLGYSYRFHAGNFLIIPDLQLKVSHYSFYTDNGYGWYGDNCAWDDAAAKYYSKLSHIEFIEQSYAIFTGMAFKYKINKLLIGCSVYVSPLLVNYVIDYHADEREGSPQEHTTYSKQISSFYGYNAGLDFEYKIAEKSALTAGINCYFTFVTKGPTGIYADKPEEKFGLTENPENWKALGQNTGNSIVELSFDIGYRLNL